MILLIDNYDSFVYNLARYVRELGEETVVRRHDATSYEEIQALGPSHIIISPGPCSPGEAGSSTDVVRRFGATIPILGVCLELRVTASAEDGEIMAVQHTRHPVIGVQFHPESVLTAYGYVLLDRFLHGAVAPLDALPDRADGARTAGAAPAPDLHVAPPPAALVR